MEKKTQKKLRIKSASEGRYDGTSSMVPWVELGIINYVCHRLTTPSRPWLHRASQPSYPSPDVLIEKLGRRLASLDLDTVLSDAILLCVRVQLIDDKYDGPFGPGIFPILAAVEAVMLEHAVELSGGVKGFAADLLKIKRTTFLEKWKKYGYPVDI